MKLGKLFMRIIRFHGYFGRFFQKVVCIFLLFNLTFFSFPAYSGHGNFGEKTEKSLESDSESEIEKEAPLEEDTELELKEVKSQLLSLYVQSLKNLNTQSSNNEELSENLQLEANRFEFALSTAKEWNQGEESLIRATVSLQILEYLIDPELSSYVEPTSSSNERDEENLQPLQEKYEKKIRAKISRLNSAISTKKSTPRKWAHSCVSAIGGVSALVAEVFAAALTSTAPFVACFAKEGQCPDGQSLAYPKGSICIYPNGTITDDYYKANLGSESDCFYTGIAYGAFWTAALVVPVGCFVYSLVSCTLACKTESDYKRIVDKLTKYTDMKNLEEIIESTQVKKN
jgi:hypothetical protein